MNNIKATNTQQRLTEWLRNYKLIQKILTGKEEEITKVQTATYKKKILDNNQNLELLVDTLRQGGAVKLLIGPTNSGKTFSMAKAFKETNMLDNKTEDKPYATYLNILAVPTRSQAQQVAQAYPDLACIVGDSKGFKDYDLTKVHNYVVVYDKLTELLESYTSNLVVRLVIDEAHNLVSAYNYRRKTVDNIEKLQTKIVNDGGTVVHMTATYQIMAYQKYDRLISLEPEQDYEANTEKVTIIKNASKQKYEDFVFNYLKDVRGIVRYNNLKVNTEIVANLQELGKTVGIVSSQEKGWKEDEAGNIKYYNETVDAIINEEKLANTDIVLSTSILDCGTNITDVKGQNNYDYKSIFCIPDEKNVDIMNIEQFFNRLRFRNNQYVILIDNQDKPTKVTTEKDKDGKEVEVTVNKQFLSLNTIIANNKNKVLKNVEYFKKSVEALKFKYTTDIYEELLEIEEDRTKYPKNDGSFKRINKVALRTEFESQAAYEYNGERNDLGCIYLEKDLTVQYNTKAVYYKSYTQFTKQYYTHQDKLIEDLETIFNKEIEVIEVTNIDSFLDTTIIDTKVKEVLATILKDEDLQLQITNKKITDEDVRGIIRTELYKEVVELVKLGISLTEAITSVITLDEKEIKEIKNDKVKDILKTLTKKENIILTNILKDEAIIEKIQEEDQKLKIENIVNSKYFTLISKAVQMGDTVSEIVKVITKVDKDKEIKEYLTNKQYTDNNNRYLVSPDTLAGKIGIVQKIILTYILKPGTTEPKRMKLTETTLTPLVEEINKAVGEQYTTRKVSNLITNMFNTYNVKYKGRVVKEVVELKLK